MNTPPPARRPLSSLTEQEAKTAYELAFPTRQYDYIEYDADDVTVLRGKDGTDLWLYDDGDVLAQNGAYSREFRAAPLVRYLDSIGIEIG